MAFTNYHIHSSYCDGSDTLEALVIAAIHKGFKAIGFASHCPMPVDNTYTMKYEKLAQYCQDVRSLRNKYKDLIQIYLGLEIDFIENVISPSSPIVQFQHLDFTIGTVRFLWGKDGKKLYQLDQSTDTFLKAAKDGYHSNPASLIRAYFASIRRMVELSKPTIVGTFDLIRMHSNGYVIFDANTEFYDTEVESTLQVLKTHHTILELNTHGIQHGAAENFYPSERILRRALDLGIPVTVNTDAHSVAELDSSLTEAYDLLRAIGYTYAYALIDGVWNPYYITEHGLNTDYVYQPTILSERAKG
jgi:histidinol-phosphatase (PHP family)